MLYVDPFRNVFKKCDIVDNMLHCNSKCVVDKLLELLPYIVEFDGQRYRHSRLAIDFCFCLPVYKPTNIMYNRLTNMGVVRL